MADAFPSSFRACCAIAVASLGVSTLCVLTPEGSLMSWPHPELLIVATSGFHPLPWLA